MVLKKQTLTFPFGKGLNDKVSDKVLPVGELTEAKNVVFDKVGKVSKRGGFVREVNTVAYSNDSLGASLSDANYGTEYNGEVLIGSKRRLFGRSSSNLSDRYIDKGALVPCEVENKFLFRNDNYKTSPVQVGYVYSGSVPTFMVCTYVRWAFGSSTNYTIIAEVRDATTEALIYEQAITNITIETASTQTNRLYRVPDPHVCVLGTKAFILYMEPQQGTGATKVRYSGIDLTSATSAGHTFDTAGNQFQAAADLGSFTASYHRPMFSADVATSAGNATVAAESVTSAIIAGSLFSSNLDVHTFTDATCDTTSGSRNVDMDSTLGLMVGDGVSGTGIPAGATVAAITDTDTFVLSANATATNTNTTLTFSRGRDETAVNGGLRFEYFKCTSGTTLTSFGATTSFDVGNSGVGSSGNAEALPVMATDDAVTPGFSLKAINDATPANGQIFYAVTNYASSGSKIKQKFALLDHDLGSQNATMQATNEGFLLRASAYAENSSQLRVIAEIVTDTSVGSKSTGRPDTHAIYYFEMSRTGGAQTSWSNSKTIAYNSSIISDLFNDGTDTYFVLSHTNGIRGSLSGNMALMQSPPITNTVRTWEIVGAIGTGNNPTNFTSDTAASLENNIRLFTSVSRVGLISTGLYRFGSNRFTNLVEYTTGAATDTFEDEAHSPAVVSINLAPSRKHKSVKTPNGLLLTGGMLYHYDGVSLTENNFLVFPFARVTGTSGGVIPTGTYLYRVVYEWYDAMGNVHRSAPSQSMSVTYAGSIGRNDIDIYALQLTRKRLGLYNDSFNGVRAVIYRTTAGGSVYHRVGAENLSDKEDDVLVTWSDYGGITDAELVDNELLYTQAGVPSNAFIGSCKDAAYHKERAFITTSNNAVKFSKHMSGLDGVNFTDGFELRVSSENIEIAAIESAREALLIFTEDDGYYVTGEGPDNAGVGSFTQPRMFAPGVGALPGADHAYHSGGTLIQTRRGIFNILPNLQPDYIGANIESSISIKQVATDLTVKDIFSIAVDEDQNEIYFFVENTASGSSNSILVFNTIARQWSEFTVGYSGSSYGVSGFLRNNSLYMLNADGNLHRMDPKQYVDYTTGSAVNYDMVLQTGYISVAGLQNMQRVYRFMVLGDYITPHDLTVDVFTDYDDATPVSHTSSISAETNPYHYRGHMKNQKCRAVKLKITAGGTSATGAAVVLDGLALEIGLRPGAFKLPAAQTVEAS